MIFHQISMCIFNITNINSIIINRKVAHVSFMLSIIKSYEKFPKLNAYGLISEYFCFKMVDSYTINIERNVAHILK